MDETVRQWAERWLAARRAKGLTSVGDDAGRFSNHVLPVLGEMPMAAVTRAHVETVVAALDDKVARGALSWKTAANTWGLITVMFRDA